MGGWGWKRDCGRRPRRPEHPATRLLGPALSLLTRWGPEGWGTTPFAATVLECRDPEARRERAPSARVGGWEVRAVPSPAAGPSGRERGVTATKSFSSSEGAVPPSLRGWRFLTFPPPAPRGRRGAVALGWSDYSACPIITHTLKSSPLT